VKAQKRTPTYLTHDPDYRRLRYVRYADDFLLGFAGPKSEAEKIKEELRTFLQEQLKLELSEEKTLVTHAESDSARFLGYEITARQVDSYRCKTTTRYKHGVRAVNGKITLRLPKDVVDKKCALYTKEGKPIHRGYLLNDSDYGIVNRYQSEFRGVVQYYLLATNVHWLSRLHWVAQGSLLRTMANKHKSTVMKIIKKHRTVVKTEEGPRKAIVVTVNREGKTPLMAKFGGIPLRRSEKAVLVDRDEKPYVEKRTELLQRLLADECEICGSKEDIQVHHVRKLADVQMKGRREKPEWMKIMSARRRKTLVVCRGCHWDIHSGRPLRRKSE